MTNPFPATSPLVLDRVPIPVNYVRNLLDLVDEFGLDTEHLLARVGLNTEQVYGCEPARRFDQFRRVMEGVRLMTGDPAIGLALGRHLTVTVHSVLGYAAISSANLGEALGLLERYLRTRRTRTRLCMPHLDVEGTWVRFCLTEPCRLGDIRVPYLEVATAALVNGLRYLLGDRFQDASLELPYAAPAHAERYTEMLGIPVYFGQAVAALRFPAALMVAPFALTDPTSRGVARQACKEELLRLEADQDWASRVRTRLMQAEGVLPSLEQLASSFHLTSRTLRRYLAALDVSYRVLLDEVRMARAERYLQAGLPVQEIADLLGYAEPSNFTRAFRRWTGQPPSAYRHA